MAYTKIVPTICLRAQDTSSRKEKKNEKHFASLCTAMLAVLLVVTTAPTLAQGPDSVSRAPRPADLPALPPERASDAAWGLLSPQWGGSWIDVGNAPFAFTRFDAGYFPKNNNVYFMGGRLSSGGTDGSVWSLNIAGIYTDMGVDLVTPVSNYTMNLLEDANGMGFYIFCGRKSDGSQTLAVQVYYPDTNSAVQLGPADNYPGSGICSSALNVVYNNKVYVVGGFDPNVAPYNWGETWVFDPLAPAGSRWSQIPSANLSRPRAYIMGAMIDDRIYAIGGNWYDPTNTACGQTLCSVPTVEVLDLSDPTPTWRDAGVADLPEPCSEGRAYSFDSISQYVDFDGTPFARRIVVTCGGWPYESERVYVYSARTNRWAAFPSLNRIRRDQAAEFIPAATYGIGLMIMWGGRSGADNNILTTPEAYFVGAGGCPVLLVDDDWDFDTTVPNDGGRPFYESALNYLGYPYDVWDAVSQGIPTAATMSSYSTTVWFTGYDWQTPISPTEQSELITYLNGGGNLFMSSQEQEYAFPGSAIMSGYFQVDSVSEDVLLRNTEGNPSDPLFAGLGPYALVRPDDWAAYWPTGGYEGPYDDVLSARPGAFEPLIYSSTDQANSTRYDGGSFKTAYLAFPLEWVNTVQERAQVLGAALRWMCPIMEPTFLPLVLRN